MTGFPPPHSSQPEGQHPYPHQSYPPQPWPRRRRSPLVLLLLVILLVAGATTVVLDTTTGPRGHLTAVTDYSSAPTANGSQGQGAQAAVVSVNVPGWREGQPITEETLGAVDAEEFFWTVYKRHAMIAVQELIQEPWVAPAGRPVATEHGPSVRTIRIVFDYRTKHFATASTSRVGERLDNASICVDGRLFMKTGTDLKEGSPYHPFSQDQYGARACPLVLNDDAYKQNGLIATWINDAFMTGGLDSDQADQFIALLRERRLVSVTKVSMVQAAARQFVAIEGEVNRIEDPEGRSETKLGTNVVRECFDVGTGRDQTRHPFPFTVGGLQGLKWVYYLDPSTLRPVVSKVETTPVLSRDGSVSPKNAQFNESVSWVQWGYPPAVPRFELSDGEQALSVAWPQGLPGK